MAYKNYYFPEENILYNVFFGVVNSSEMRDHSMEIMSQRKLSPGYLKITDGTLVNSVVDITEETILMTASVKQMGTVRSGGGVIISNSLLVDAVAERYVEAGKRDNEVLITVRSLDEAVEHCGVPHLKERLQKEIDSLALYFPRTAE